MQTPDVVISRVKPVQWSFIIGIATMAVLCPIGIWFDKSSPLSAKWMITGMALVGPGLIAASGAFIAWRHRIVADAEGLEWFSWIGMKRVTWPEVREYYNTRGNEHVNGIVVTDKGTLSLGNAVTNVPQLRTAIVERALWATTREWGLRGEQFHSGEVKSFRYGISMPFLFVLGFGCIGCGFFFAFMGPGVSLQNPIVRIQHDLAIMPPALVLIPFAMQCFLGLGMASLYPLFVWPVFFAMWPRRKEVIELTSDGIRWQSPPRTIAATWDEVKGIRTTPLPGPAKHATIQTIETIRGDISYIPLAIDQNYILQRLIEKYRPADALVTSETDGPQTEPLAADSLTFTYRVPVNRAMLWLAFFEFGQPGFLGLLGIFGIFVPKGNTNPWSFLAFSSAAWLLCAYGWLAYYCSKVKLRDTGLEYTNAWSQTRIRWDEITAIGWTSYTSTIRTKDKTLRLGVLTDRSTLMNEIRRRAPQAEILDWPASESQN